MGKRGVVARNDRARARRAKQRERRSAEVKVPKLEKSGARRQPLRMVLYSEPGWGKTTTAAYATDAALIMGRGETGYETLLGAGLVPEIPRVEVASWSEHMALLRELAGRDELPYKVLSLDTTGALEQLCHEHVCRRDFNGNWSQDGFLAFQKGPKTAVQDWLQMQALLDRIREKHHCSILLLGHMDVRKSRRPLEEDFDQAALDVEKETLGPLRRWSDCIFFGAFEANVTEDGLRKKATGEQQRVLYTQNGAAHLAKNRLGMTPVLEMSDDPSENWEIIREEMVGRHNETDDEGVGE